jgi:hypothetical protein
MCTAQRAASRTIVLIFSTFGSRIGQVLSVATHCASPMPQPQLQRALLAATSAVRFCDEVSDEKSTTRMARSLYATPDISDSPYPAAPTTPAATSHVIHFARFGRTGLRVARLLIAAQSNTVGSSGVKPPVTDN